jgi:D-beta-D-heptose 7-phosphate kinase/D-beta-D-heptose 1-phosphate adenosyltransferase
MANTMARVLLKDKMKNLGELLKIVNLHKKESRKIAFTNGCYDIIHVGHIRCLQEARRLGDSLIVALNSDRSVRSLKGCPRPFIPQEERAEMISALECVDYVIIFDQDNPLELINAIEPDVLVKGGDWNLDTIVGRDVVESYGGKVFALPLVPGISTTQIINAIASHSSESGD